MYNTDKNELLGEYEKLFASKKNDQITLLEIGVWEGGSLKWARDFFPNGQIVGIDLKLPNIKEDRITMQVCDQNNVGGLEEVAEQHGQFDIIIDDGSHLEAETRICFNTLWKHLKKGGWYVIEDWDAYTIAPQFEGIADFVQELLKFDCEKKVYFKNNKAFASFKK